MGKTRFTVYLKCGSVEVRDVDYCTGWDYCGEYLILQETQNGVSVYHPYSLHFPAGLMDGFNGFPSEVVNVP